MPIKPLSESLRADPAATIISTSLILPLNVKFLDQLACQKINLPPRSLITVGNIITSVIDDRNIKCNIIFQ